MKRILACILILVMVFSVVACGGSPKKRKKDKESGIDRGEALNGISQNINGVNMDNIVFSTVYSDGVAVVNLSDDEKRAHIIDKKGNIIRSFDLLDGDTGVGLGYYRRFESGIYIYNGICYDTKGNVTTPETVGATAFVAVEGGQYVMAEKITSTYDSTKKELAVFTLAFDVVLPFSEENYNSYHGDSQVFLKKVNGVSAEIPGFDFRTITNHSGHTEFVNGKAAVQMWNPQSEELYITVVDALGNFLFEPIKTDVNNSLSVSLYFDGEYIVLSGNRNFGSGYPGVIMKLYTYDITGKKIAEWNASENIDTWAGRFEYNNGVITFWLTTGQYSDYYRTSRVKYFTYDYKELF